MLQTLNPVVRVLCQEPAIQYVPHLTLQRDTVDDAVARFFYANGLSFNVANSQVWMLEVHAE
jgi:hypothetical protein